MKTINERFDDNYTPEPNSGCWLWIGDTSIHGYGRLCVNRKSEKAHRVSWVIHNGAIPLGSGYHGTCVLHKCDNKVCVNPKHLFLGSNTDNVADMVKKGRTAKGVNNGGSKLTESQVLLIRRLCLLKSKLKITYKTIAKMFGIHTCSVGEINRRITWKHI